MTDPRSLVRAPLLVPSPLERYYAQPTRRALAGDVILLALGDLGLEGNLAAVLGPEAPEHVFALAADFFGGEPYGVIVEVGSAATVEAAVRAAGWELDEDEPAMVLQPIPAAPPPPAELEIRLVTTEAELADFMALSGTGSRWVPSLAAARDPGVALLVGYLRDEPVATARISCLGAVGEINGVGTLPDQRRRGYGTAMTWAAIAEGQRRGCDAITLSASEMGYSVYRHMGFVPVCRYRTYLPPTG
ncbi:MAG TPA: GNAT family N-acetyltransferase [Thermomicrobiaceae bacterium]|nr:GNAT family N-acetyltransferase [Thermomicrobiaceae bacterium]